VNRLLNCRREESVGYRMSHSMLWKMWVNWGSIGGSDGAVLGSIVAAVVVD